MVDERALVKALKDGEIRGEDLDAFENGPELQQGLTELDNAVTGPHIASVTIETMDQHGHDCCE